MKTHPLSLAYCTNIWVHHQVPVCTELVRSLGENHFKLCLFEKVSEERRKLGYACSVPGNKWIAGPPSSPGDMERLKQIVCNADVAVLGACPEEIQASRASTGKLTFIMSERMMRGGYFHLRMLNPRFARGIRRLRSIFNRPNVHYLAIGDYAVADAKLMGVFGDRIWNWGYFVSYASAPFRERTSSSVKMLWVGRMLSLKRVDMILRAMVMLGPAVANCTLEIIGDGPIRKDIKHLAHRFYQDNRVNFIDSMPHEDVRERMAQADIYVFPSNHREGWGAVVGEAMSEGCVVVASKAAGASRVLIDHGRTGFLFDDGDVCELTEILRQIIANGELRHQIGQAAYEHMQKLWHPRIGAERLIALCQGLLGRELMPEYTNGPCCRVPKKII